MEWLLSMIKCNDMIPEGKKINEKMNQLCFDLENNTKRTKLIETGIFELKKNIAKYQNQTKFDVTRIMKFEEKIEQYCLMLEIEKEASK